MAEKIVKKVIIDVDDKGGLKRTSKDSQTLNRNMKGLSQQSSNASKNFSKTAQGMQGVLVPAYAEVAARVFALSAAYNALSRAADFRILMQGQAEYAKRTGKNMADIARQVQAASKHMLGFAEASSAVALATTSGISSSQIVTMTKRAVDSSTALGRSVEDTMDRLTRGIVKAEPEILDEIGVIIRLDKVYKDYAESVKKSTAELSEGEKATARYNAIMGQLEAKFGGIADKVDPNYMRAAAAATLDILAQSSARLVGVINPIFKFLSEAKAVIVVILMVIIKTLAGKVFPAFEGLGARLARMPQAMHGNVMKLQMDLDTMNAKMRESALIAKNVSTAIAKNIPKQMQFLGSGKDAAGKFSKASEATQIRSLRSKVAWAKGHMEKGIVTSGSMVGMTAAEVAIVDKQVQILAKDLGNTHKINQVLWNKGKVAMLGFKQGLARIRQGFWETAKAASFHFNTTKQLMVDNGMLKGTWMGLQGVAAGWRKAALAAGVYNRVIRVTTAVTGALGVMAAFAGKMINQMFAIVMWLTMIVSIGKMLIGMFVDFDTPFKRAAEAAKTLNDELKEQETLFSQRDSIINFEGAATSFDEAMEQATFADNFATSLYESTSKAMKALSAEMGEMGFWEGAFDWVKDLFGMGSMDYQKKAIARAIRLTREGPGGSAIMADMREKYGISGTRRSDDFETKYSAWRQDQRPQGMDTFTWEGLVKSFEASSSMWFSWLNKNAGGDISRSAFEGSAAGKKAMEARTLEDYFDSDEFKALADTEGAQTKKLLEMYTDLNTAQKEAADSAKILRIDLTEMSTAFEAISKAQTKFTDSLLEKTAVHDMAVQQQKLLKLFGEDGSASDQTKYLALQKQGLLTDKMKGGITYGQLVQAQEAGDQVKTRDLAAALYKEQHENIQLILGDLEDWIEYDKTLTENITRRLGYEAEIAMLSKYASKTGAEERMRLNKKIAEQEINIARKKLEVMEEENRRARKSGGGLFDVYSYEKLKLAEATIDSMNMKMKMGQTQAQTAYANEMARTGQKGTIQGRYAAIRADLDKNIHGYDKEALEAEEMHEYEVSVSKFLDSVHKGSVKAEKSLANLRHELSMTGGLNDFAERLRDGGFGKFMDISTDPANMHRLERLFGTDEGRKLVPKIKATKLALEHLKIEQDNIGKHKILINLRKKMADIDMKVQDKGLALEEKRLENAKAIATLQLEVNKLQREEDLKYIRSTIQSVADGFGNAITKAFQDIFEGNKDQSFLDTVREGIGKGLTSAASSNLGGMAKTAVFGNQGFLAGMLRNTPFAGIVDDIFPKTQLEVAQDSLAELKAQTVLLGGSSLLAGLGSNTIRATGSTNYGGDFLSYLMSTVFRLGKGGYARGGFRAFASGGIASRPTLGMIGEGRYNEAVVPLPDGRAIPVKGVGGNVTVNVAVDAQGQSAAAEVTGNGARELGYRVSQAVQQELVDQQRPGGLLSSY